MKDELNPPTDTIRTPPKNRREIRTADASDGPWKLFAAAEQPSASEDYAGPQDVSDQAGFGFRYGKMDRVNGLVVHHTADNHSQEQGIADAHASGLGPQYRMDRDGSVIRIAPEGARMHHMLDGYGPLGRGRTSRTMEGLEVAAHNEDDLTDAQRAALPVFAAWHAKRYGYDPSQGVFGHSEVNPGHRSNEGERFASAFRAGAPLPTGGVGGGNRMALGAGDVPADEPANEEDDDHRMFTGSGPAGGLATAAAWGDGDGPWKLFSGQAPKSEDDGPWKLFQQSADKTPSPGFFKTAAEAGRRGLVEGLTQVGQAASPFKDRPQDEAAKDDVGKLLEEKLSQGLSHPLTWAGAQIAHAIGSSFPTLALGLGGTALGGAAGSAVPVVGTAIGAAGGGATGFALGSAIQTIAPAYQKARAEGMEHDAAVNRAFKETGISAAFGAAMGLAPGVSLFGTTVEGALKRPISEALAQIFAVQPALGAGQQLTTANLEGRPVSLDEFGTGYITNAGVGGALVGGHAVVKKAVSGSRYYDPRQPASGPDPYATLGIEPTATAGEIKSAFRARAKETHPDSGGQANDFDAVVQAYRILNDQERRAQYDASGARPAPAPESWLSSVKSWFSKGAKGPLPEESAPPSARPEGEEPASASPVPRQGDGLAGDQPTAEPIGDLVAQAKDLEDPQNPRQAVWVPKSSIESISSDDHKTWAALDVGVAVPDFDGKGGLLLARDQATADAAVKARDEGLGLQEVIGRLTGAGAGKPAAGTHVVQQFDPKTGAVTRESLVTEAELGASWRAFQAPGREVRVVTQQEALARRQEGVAAQPQPGTERAGKGRAGLLDERVSPEEAARIDAQLPTLTPEQQLAIHRQILANLEWRGAEPDLQAHHRKMIERLSAQLGLAQGEVLPPGHREHDARGYLPRMTAAEAKSVLEQRDRQAARRAGAETVEPAQPQPVAFTTAKGSTYQVQPDGTTVRDKAARSDPGHEGQQGPQPQSEKTYYVDPADAQRLALPEGKSIIVDYGDGTLSVASLNTKTGKWGISPDSRNIPVSAQPAVGKAPVELWGKGTVYGRDAYQKIHLGNEITAVRQPGTRSSPVKAETAADVARAGSQAAEPTDGQREAGNYQKGHIQLHGLDISIETPHGAVRRGKGWQVTSPAAYGYIKGVPARSRDKEHVDVYVGDHPTSERAFIVNQHDPKTGRFDEAKVVLGARSADEAIAIYDRGFSDGSGPARRGSVVETSTGQLKDLLANHDFRQPVPEQASEQKASYRGPHLTEAETDEVVSAWDYVRDVEAAEAEHGDAVNPESVKVASEIARKLQDHGLSAQTEEELRAHLAGAGAASAEPAEPHHGQEATGEPRRGRSERASAAGAEPSAEQSNRGGRSEADGAASGGRGRNASTAEPGGAVRPAGDGHQRAAEPATLTDHQRGQDTGRDRAGSAGQATRVDEAYGDPGLHARLMGSADDGVRNVAGALEDAASSIASLKAAVRDGRVAAEDDIAPQVAEAARLIADLREGGVNPAELKDAEGLDKLHPRVASFLRAFYNGDLAKPTTRQALSELLKRYAHDTENAVAADRTSARDVIAAARLRSLQADEAGTVAKPTEGAKDTALAGERAAERADARDRAANQESDAEPGRQRPGQNRPVKDEPFVLGKAEWVTLPELGLPALKAKIDTGAQTSSLHAVDIEKVGDKQVKFSTTGKDGRSVQITADLVGERDIKSSNGQLQRRYVIETQARMGGRAWPIEITLTDRGSMQFPMLIGRQALQEGMLVNPGASYVQGGEEGKKAAGKPQFAIGGDIGSEEGHVSDWEEAHFEELSRRAHHIEVATGRAPAARSEPKPAMERAADAYAKEVGDLETSLRKDGKTWQQTADAIQSKYGFPVEAGALAKGEVWWRANEGSGGHKWPQRAKDTFRKLWAEGVPLKKIGETVSEILGRPLSNSSLLYARHHLGLPPRGIGRVTIPANVRAYIIQRLKDRQSDPSVSAGVISKEVQAKFDHLVRPDYVRVLARRRKLLARPQLAIGGEAAKEAAPRTNADGFILRLPYAERWGDPRFDPDDRAHALDRLREIQTMPVREVPWKEIVEARRDINEITNNLFYYAPDMSPDIIKRMDEVSWYMDDPHGLRNDKPDAMPSFFRDKPADERAADIAEFATQGRQAIDHMLDAGRAGVRNLLLRSWNDTEPRVRRHGVTPVAPDKIGETLPSGFYFKSGRKLADVPAPLFHQGGEAVINWLRKNGVTYAEVSHFQLQEKFGTREPTTREAFAQAIADRMFDFRRKTSWLNPERSKKDYELGGTRAFRGPRVPGRGVYGEDLLALPKKLKGGEEFAPGMFESPHWEDVFKGTMLSDRVSLREVPELGGKLLLSEENQSDYMQGAHTGRRQRIAQKDYLAYKAERGNYQRVMQRAGGLVDDALARSGIADYHLRQAIRGDLVPLHGRKEWDAQTWRRSLDGLRNKIQKAASAAASPDTDRRLALQAFSALDMLQDLRAKYENYFEPGAGKKYNQTERSFTPESPLDKTYVATMARNLFVLAAKTKANAIGIPTTETSNRIQNNAAAGHFYDNQLKPRLERELRRLTGDSTIALEKVALPKAMGAPRNEKPYTVWAAKIAPDALAKVRAEGESMFAVGDDQRPLSERLSEFRANPKAAGEKTLPAKFKSAIPDIRQAIGSQLATGKPVKVRAELVAAVHKAAEPVKHMLPEGTDVYVLSRIEPLEHGQVAGVFTNASGGERVVGAPWAQLSSARAFYLDRGVFFTRLSARSLKLAGEFNGSVTAELGHEAIHALKSAGRFDDATWGRLLAQGNALRILDGQYGTYLQIVGDPAAKRVNPDMTVRDAYQLFYKGRGNLQDLMDQESVAHMMEWHLRGQLSDNEVAPVRDILEAIRDGRVGAEGSAAVAAEPAYAAAAREGEEQRRELDRLGFFSKALEAAKGLKQAKGTPEQMLAQLKSAGVKEAEIKATGLDKFLLRETDQSVTAGARPSSESAPVSDTNSPGEEGRTKAVSDASVSRNKNTVTKSAIVSFLTQNRVEVKESVYGRKSIDFENRNGVARTMYGRSWDELAPAQQNEAIQNYGDSSAKWSQYSLDPSNPTYRESVIHLPLWSERANNARYRALRERYGANPDALGHGMTREEIAEFSRLESNDTALAGGADFRQGHFAEPNVIAHARTSLQKDAQGRPVFLVDELQSDWGQKLRDGGALDEAKIADLTKRREEAIATLAESRKAATDFLKDRGVDVSVQTKDGWRAPTSQELVNHLILTRDKQTDPHLQAAAENLRVRYAGDEVNRRLIDSEYTTATAATPGHPLVNTTDQWTTTAFRRLIRQAVEAGAEKIAIVPGKTQHERGFGKYGVPMQLKEVRVHPAMHKGATADMERQVQLVDAALHRSNTIRVDGSGVITDGGRDVRPGGKLPGYLGGDLAAKVMAVKPEHGVTTIADAGMRAGGYDMESTYDAIYPRMLGKLLAKMDPSIKMDDGPLHSSLDNRQFTHDREEGRKVAVTGGTSHAPILFHTFPLTDKVKAIVRGEGQPLFAIGGSDFGRETDQPGAGAQGEEAARTGEVAASSVRTPKLSPHSQADLAKAMEDALGIVGRIAGKDLKVSFRPTLGVGKELRPAVQAMDQALGRESPAAVGGFYRPEPRPADVGLDRHLYDLREGIAPVVRADALIGLATSDPHYSLRTTAGHEAWHHVEETLATPAELKLLNSPAEMERMRRRAADEIGLQPDDPRLAQIDPKEIRALAFQRYRREREEGMQPASGIHIALRKFYDKMIAVLNGIKNLLMAKKLGYKDIFENARSGGMAQRGPLEANRTKIAEAYDRDIFNRDAAAGSDVAQPEGPSSANLASSIPSHGPPNGKGPPPSPPAGGAAPGGRKGSAEEAILARVVPSSKTQRRMPTLNELYTRVKDDLNPLRIVRNALAEGKTLPVEKDPYILSRLTRGNAGKAEQFLQYGAFRYSDLKTVGPSLRAILRSVNLDGLRAYAVARRTLELSARGIETGVPLPAARQTVANGDAHYKAAFDRLVGYQRHVLQYLRDSGVLSLEDFVKVTEANKDYVPFFRLMDDDMTGADLGGRGLRVSQPIKGIKGSERQIIDPIESIVRNTYLYLDVAERNRAMQALVELADSSPRGAEFLQKLKPKMHPVMVTEAEVQKWMNDEGIAGSASGFTVFRPNAFRPAPDEIVAYRKGKREVYKVDPELGNAINAMDRERVNGLMKILGAPARLLRAGATLAPEFVVRNPIRDQFSAFSFSSNGYVPVYDLVRGMGALFGKGEDFQNWLKSGGANSAMVGIDRQYIHDNIVKLNDPTIMGRVKGVITSPIEALRIASELMENATRLGEFKRAMEAGKSPMGAAYDAREVTLDFARMGTQGRAVNQLIAFWNAQVEGVDRAARAFGEAPFRTLMKVALSITLPSILLWLANKDDPRWPEIPNWERDIFWLIMTNDWKSISADEADRIPAAYKRQLPTGQWEQNKGSIWRIPKPFELGVLFGSVPERILDAYTATRPNAFKDILKSMQGAFLPSFIPQAAGPLIEQFANRSLFLDRDLVPKAQQNVQYPRQETPYTSEVAKILGRAIGKMGGDKSSFSSPIIVDNYIHAWSGGLGQHALSIVDASLRKSGLAPERFDPTPTAADMPLLKAFAVRFPMSGAQSVQNFYDTYEERAKALTTVKYLKKVGRGDEAAEVAQENALTTAEGIHKAIGNQHKFIRDTYRDPKISADDKRQIIDRTYLQMIEMAKRGNEVFARTVKTAAPAQ